MKRGSVALNTSRSVHCQLLCAILGAWAVRNCGWSGELVASINPRAKAAQSGRRKRSRSGEWDFIRDPEAEQVSLGQSRAMKGSVLSQSASAAPLSQQWSVPFANACRGSKPLQRWRWGSCREPDWVPWLIQRRFIIQQLKIVLQQGCRWCQPEGTGRSECKCVWRKGWCLDGDQMGIRWGSCAFWNVPVEGTPFPDLSQGFSGSLQSGANSHIDVRTEGIAWSWVIQRTPGMCLCNGSQLLDRGVHSLPQCPSRHILAGDMSMPGSDAHIGRGHKHV